MSYNPNEPRDKDGKWTDGGGPNDAATFTASIAQNVHDKGYLYHATNEENLRSIAADGVLKTHAPSYGTFDQNVWPDGSKQKRAYFAGDVNVTTAFFPEQGRPVIVRIKASPDIKQEAYTRDYYSTKPIPASAIEYLASDGTWHSLASGPVKVTRTRNPVDRLPGIGGGANGSPVRHR